MPLPTGPPSAPAVKVARTPGPGTWRRLVRRHPVPASVVSVARLRVPRVPDPPLLPPSFPRPPVAVPSNSPGPIRVIRAMVITGGVRTPRRRRFPAPSPTDCGVGTPAPQRPERDLSGLKSFAQVSQVNTVGTVSTRVDPSAPNRPARSRSSSIPSTRAPMHPVHRPPSIQCPRPSAAFGQDTCGV